MRRMSRSPISLLALALATACATGSRGAELATADGRHAATLVAPAYDGAQHEATSKVYHHVFAPDGRLLTKGDGGEYPHHRGLFLGWNRTKAGDRTFDFWHLNHGESQRRVGSGSPGDLGLPDGAQVTAIDWCGADGDVIVHELRGLAAAALPDGAFALHLRTRLTTALARVDLGGDPQHAGCQFRALQRFAERGAEPVRYLRPAAAIAHADDVWTGCDWIAAVLPLPDGPVTVLRVEGATNPGAARWSTRAYGRFGAVQQVAVTCALPLVLDWFYVIATGERDAAWCARTAADLRG